MEPELRQRIVGATVLVALAVLLIPALLHRNEPPPPRVVPRDMAPMPAVDFTTAPAPLEPALVTELEAGLAEGAAPIPDPATPAAATAAPLPPPLTALRSPAATAAPPVASLPATPAPASAGPWFVQLGSFGSRDNAERLQARLRAAGHAAVIAPLGGAGGTSYRVRIARPDRAAAESLRAMLARGEGYRGILVHD